MTMENGAVGMMDAWAVKSPKQAMRAIQKEVRQSVDAILREIKESMEKAPMDWNYTDGYYTIYHNKKWLVKVNSNKKIKLFVYDGDRYGKEGSELPLTWWQRSRLKSMVKNLTACRLNFESYQKLKRSLETIITQKV